ncbi:MAG: hypothetical protein NTW87_16100 [Planctomycetota bacterium]|nr:hypothetical protein [Planctomycetota bacterium]
MLAQCDAGLAVFRDIPDIAKHRGIAEVQELLNVREKLLDLRRAADRLWQRQEAERQFRELDLRVSGVIASGRHALAIVNGRTATRGAVVATSDNQMVTVDEIRPDHVVFVWRGFKIAVALPDVPQPR